MSTVRPDVVIDTKGLISPMPVLKAKKAIDRLAQGQMLSVISTDAAAARYTDACRETRP